MLFDDDGPETAAITSTHQGQGGSEAGQAFSSRHHCPVSPCKSSYATAQALLNHIETIHLAREHSASTIPDSFLQAYSRWLCCGLFMPLHKACRECSKRGPRDRRRCPKEGELPANRGTPEACPLSRDTTEVPADLQAQTEALLSIATGTVHHLPPAARKPLADALCCALRRLHEKNDAWSAWQVALLPRLVLGPLVRGGRKHNRQATGVILDRLRRWNAGAFRDLVLQALLGEGKGGIRQTRHKPRQEEKSTSLEHDVQRRVVQAVAEGALSKAAKLLYKGARPSDDVEALRALHPQREVAATPVIQQADERLEFEAEDIRRACKTLPPGSTGGPTGLRPCHIQEMLSSDDDDLLASALADFVSDFNAGILPQQAQPWFCGARLIGLEKQPAGVRPIAVGETLRRVAGKCLVQRCQGEVLERLLPHQLGVGVPSACEVISHAVRPWAESAAPDESHHRRLLERVQLLGPAEDAGCHRRRRSRLPPLCQLLLRHSGSTSRSGLHRPVVGGNSARGLLRAYLLLRHPDSAPSCMLPLN